MDGNKPQISIAGCSFWSYNTMGHSIPRQFRFGRKVPLPHDYWFDGIQLFWWTHEQCPYGQLTKL